jgi:ATP-dependent Clp protease protease subunit
VSTIGNPGFRSPGGSMSGFGDMLDERLLRERIIWLEGEVRDENSDRIAKQLQVLAAEDPERDISIYINSPGGSITAGMVIYDTMQLIPNDVATVAMGLAASMGQFLLCAGAPGKRYATPNTRIMMHQPLGGIGGTASDIKIQAEQMLFIKKRMATLIAEHSGQTIEQIEKDSDRDRWFTAEDARDYGLIDHVYSTDADAPGKKGSAK